MIKRVTIIIQSVTGSSKLSQGGPPLIEMGHMFLKSCYSHKLRNSKYEKKENSTMRKKIFVNKL